MSSPGGLDNSQLVGQFGQDDVIEVLRSTFSRAEIATELPDHGTDVVCKIPSPGLRFYPVEWRIQVKASTSGALATSITTRRAEQVLGTSGNHWLLFFVCYDVSPDDLATMDPVDRRASASLFVLDLREVLRDRLRSDPAILQTKDELFISVPPGNRVNKNLLVHLWGVGLWDQVAGLFHGRACDPELTTDCARLVSAWLLSGRGPTVRWPTPPTSTGWWRASTRS